MFYHIIIETKDKSMGRHRDGKILELDKTDILEIQDSVIMPFLRREDLHFDGYFVKADEIKRVSIRRTAKTSRDLADAINQNTPSRVIMKISPKGAVEWENHSTDVTNELFNNAKKALSHQSASITESPQLITTNRREPAMPRTTPERPRLFVGSSREGMQIAEAIQANLEHDMECTIWNQGAFGLSQTRIESLEQQLKNNSEFAVLVIHPDDVTESRGEKAASPRDNVIFELGLFMGILGRSHTFMIRPHHADLKMPSDLAGITIATYDDQRSDGNFRGAVTSACAEIKRAITKARS
jgi:predicted nucleotide-binding protein